MGILSKINEENKARPDKATYADFIKAAKRMPDADQDAIPWCIYEKTGEIDEDGNPVRRVNYDRLLILATIAEQRENRDITEEELAEQIDMNALPMLIKEVFFFWIPTMEREEFEKLWGRLSVRTIEEGESEEAEEPENPISIETSSETTN